MQPIKEDYLMTGKLEETNDAYAIAKISGIKMCQAYNDQYNTNFLSVMPTNLYGVNDNFDLNKSHVLPAMIKKMHLAKLFNEGKINKICDLLEIDEDIVEIILKGYSINENSVSFWGTGKPMREFLYSDDMADACLFIMKNLNKEDLNNIHINIGTGKDITIQDLSYLVKEIVNYKGNIKFDFTKPDGTPKKLLDVSKLEELGWKYKMSLKKRIKKVYKEVFLS